MKGMGKCKREKRKETANKGIKERKKQAERL
jgi:hypothetical protein